MLPANADVTAIFRDATTRGTLAASRTMTVSSKTLVSIAVTPANPTIAAGLTTQMTATGTFSDGSTGDLTDDVTWSVMPAVGVAAVSNDLMAGTKGEVTGHRPGHGHGDRHLQR